jgi:hypothetical protein
MSLSAGLISLLSISDYQTERPGGDVYRAATDGSNLIALERSE